MELNYNITELYSAAFGLNPELMKRYNIPSELPLPEKKYKPNMQEEPKPELVYTINGPFRVDESNVKSVLGTPVMFPIKFLGGSYNLYENNQITQVDVEEFMLPFTAISDFKRAKVKTKTRISGGNGTVKELFALDDWQINIQGLFIGAGAYPQEEIERMLEFEKLADSIRVEGRIFELLSIYEIDINDISIKQLKGYPNVASFSLACESNEPTELILK